MNHVEHAKSRFSLLKRNPDISLSLEFFPPKTEKAAEALWEDIPKLAALNPSYISVTYGAGGSSKNWTVDTAIRIFRETMVPTAAHLTCIGTKKSEIENIARKLHENHIHHIIALRGDMPKDGVIPDSNDNDYYHYANELIEGLYKICEFDISVAAYPEKHPEAPNIDVDIDNLKKKFDAGASRAITQFFFDNNKYYDFLEKVRKAGINAPIIPGIFPISNFENTVKFAKMCNTSIPKNLYKIFENKPSCSEEHIKRAAEICAAQICDLRDNGVKHFHFYTLNRSRLVVDSCNLSGIII